MDTETDRTYKELDRLLNKSKNWTCSLQFTESDHWSDKKIEVDLIQKMKTCDYAGDNLYIFPERFMGKDKTSSGVHPVVNELKKAAIQAGFNLVVRSSLDSNSLSDNNMLSYKITLACQQARVYNQGKKKKTKKNNDKKKKSNVNYQTNWPKKNLSFSISNRVYHNT